jgi:hypothetical protein
VAEVYTDDIYKQKTAYDDLGPRFFDALAEKIGEKMEACGSRVPVITGKPLHTGMVLLIRLRLIILARFFWRDAIFSSAKRWPWLLRLVCRHVCCWSVGFRAADLEGGRWYLYCRPTKSPFGETTGNCDIGRSSRIDVLWERG